MKHCTLTEKDPLPLETRASSYPEVTQALQAGAVAPWPLPIFPKPETGGAELAGKGPLPNSAGLRSPALTIGLGADAAPSHLCFLGPL